MPVELRAAAPAATSGWLLRERVADDPGAGAIAGARRRCPPRRAAGARAASASTRLHSRMAHERAFWTITSASPMSCRIISSARSTASGRSSSRRAMGTRWGMRGQGGRRPAGARRSCCGVEQLLQLGPAEGLGQDAAGPQVGEAVDLDPVSCPRDPCDAVAARSARDPRAGPARRQAQRETGAGPRSSAPTRCCASCSAEMRGALTQALPRAA